MELFDVYTPQRDLMHWDVRFPHTVGSNILILPDAALYYLGGGFGDMYFQGIQSPDRYRLWLNQYDMHKTRKFVAEAENSSFELSILLNNKVNFSMFDKMHTDLSAQQYNLYYLPYIKNETVLYEHQHYASLDIHFTLQYFEKLAAEYPDVFGKHVDSTYRKEPVIFNKHAFFMGEELRSFARHIVKMVVKGRISIFYLNVAVKMLLLTSVYPDHPEIYFQISPAEEEKIFLAEQTLMKNLSEFTSIKELSKIAGMNKNKLKYLFKNRFSMPPRKYWNQFRMDKALELLLNGNHTVVDVCDSLGFQDVSSFSRAFKNKFSVTPSELQRRKFH